MHRLRRALVVALIAGVFYFVWLRLLGLPPSARELRVGVGVLFVGAVLIAVDAAVSRSRGGR